MNNNDIYIIYLNILDNYTINFTKNLYNKLNNNIDDLEYIFKNGISILTNIFLLNIIKNKNKIFMTNICDKIYTYYIEFINQLYSSYHENTVMLSLQDAKLFCYKKFINELNNCENIENKKIIIKNLDKKIFILKYLFSIIYNNYEFNYYYLNANKNQDKLNNNEIKNNKINNEIIIDYFNEKNKILYKYLKKIKIHFFTNYLDNIDNIDNIDNNNNNDNNDNNDNIDNLYKCLLELYNYIKLNQKENKFFNVYIYLDKFINKKLYLLKDYEFNIND